MFCELITQQNIFQLLIICM